MNLKSSLHELSCVPFAIAVGTSSGTDEEGGRTTIEPLTVFLNVLRKLPLSKI